MSDLQIVVVCIGISLLGYFCNSNYNKNKVIKTVLLIFAILILLSTHFFFNLPSLFIAIELISGCLGYILAFFHPLYYLNLLILFFTGAFCLSSHSNQLSMFLCLTILFFGSYYYVIFLKPKNVFKDGFFLSVGLILYFIISLVLNIEFWFNGLLIGLFSILTGIYYAHSRIKEGFILLPIICFAVFAFRIYPDFSIVVSREILIHHELDYFNDIKAAEKNRISDNDDGIVMIETWHQYCSKCFQSMKDLHSYFLHKETQYPFKHYYLFVGEGMVSDSIYRYKHLPFDDQRILIDSNLIYYNTLQMKGAPYFNFYKDGEYIFSISGYDERYIGRYKKYFDREFDEIIN